MTSQKRIIKNIPATIWGEPSEKVFLFTHGRMGSKDDAQLFASIAEEFGYQTISFDLPEHGERKENSSYKCTIFNCMEDAKTIAEYTFKNWAYVSLYGCSLGAQICLQTFCNDTVFPFEDAIFLSPIIDMNYLIDQMMEWFNISEYQLRNQKFIETPIDVLTIDQYDFYRTHPISIWPFQTNILFGAKDNLQNQRIHSEFLESFGGILTISDTSEHPFMAPDDRNILTNWYRMTLSENHLA